MTRGPESRTGFAAALPVARRRGHVDLFRHGQGSRAEFLIAGSVMLAIVRLRRATCLHGTVADIASIFRTVIDDFRSYPAGGPLFRRGYEFFGFEGVDHLVIGEAEDLIPRLVRDIEDGCVAAPPADDDVGAPIQELDDWFEHWSTKGARYLPRLIIAPS